MDENKESATAQENPQQTNDGPLPPNLKEWRERVNKMVDDFVGEVGDPEKVELLVIVTGTDTDTIRVHRRASHATEANVVLAMVDQLPRSLALKLTLKILQKHG